MWFLEHHLAKQHGFEGHLFSYPSVHGTLDENAELLADFVGNVSRDEPLHLVGHSLGGVLLVRMLALNPQAPVDRAVCIASPLRGSRAANHLSERKWGRMIIGKSVADGVVGESASEWAGDVTVKHDIGIIAGTVAAGLGRLVATFDEPNDGTIAVEETRLSGAKDHICMHLSHSALVFSGSVAEQVAAFLRHGQFQRN
jgi:pimeloyl-ACP methyl ester carboxylesterase